MIYSVFIRTLRTVGEKYLHTLLAVANQTVKHQKIYVALPHGYENPKETLGIETIIPPPKKKEWLLNELVPLSQWNLLIGY